MWKLRSWLAEISILWRREVCMGDAVIRHVPTAWERDEHPRRRIAFVRVS